MDFNNNGVLHGTTISRLNCENFELNVVCFIIYLSTELIGALKVINSFVNRD